MNNDKQLIIQNSKHFTKFKKSGRTKFLSLKKRTCPEKTGRMTTLHWGRRVIEISGSLIWSKTLMELIFNPCGEFRWSPEGPVCQIHSSHLLVGVPRIFSDLLRFVQMLKRERKSGVRKPMGSYRTYPSLVKLQPEFQSLRWKTCLWAELRPWFLSLLWRTFPWAEYSDDDDDDDDVARNYREFLVLRRMALMLSRGAGKG